MNYAKAIRELDNKQDRIYYRIDIYSSFASLKPVIYLIKEGDKVASNNETFQWGLKELVNILKAETEILINSITVVGIKTLLNTASITL